MAEYLILKATEFDAQCLTTLADTIVYPVFSSVTSTESARPAMEKMVRAAPASGAVPVNTPLSCAVEVLPWACILVTTPSAFLASATSTESPCPAVLTVPYAHVTPPTMPKETVAITHRPSLTVYVVPKCRVAAEYLASVSRASSCASSSSALVMP